MSKIHPTAIIDPTAEIAPSATIGPYCTIGPRVHIGADCILRVHCHITALTRMGKGNEIHPYAIVGGDPQDLKFHGEPTWLEMGDFNTIREHVTIHRGTGNGGGVTRVGSHNLIMGNVHIAHDAIIGSHCIFANNAMLAGHVHVDDYANIGGGSGLHHFTRVGYCGFVGGLSRVSKDVPPFMLVEGSPAAIRGYNNVAMSRIGMSEMEMEAVKEAYKRLFRVRGGAGLSKIASLLRDYPNSKALRRIVESVQAVHDGVNGRALEGKRLDDKRAVRAVRG
ncbi:MAG: acyl-ACP--UDP-N-acetylglucosamine O-acyltransferase [Phycisphaerales bacterium]|nr:acyl-ACP--UDP-N-acetylglucosamine O-acyltransferase [Phycisphaerales bacterium]